MCVNACQRMVCKHKYDVQSEKKKNRRLKPLELWARMQPSLKILFYRNHKNAVTYPISSSAATFSFGKFVLTEVGAIFLTSSVCPLFACTEMVSRDAQLIQGNKVDYFSIILKVPVHAVHGHGQEGWNVYVILHLTFFLKITPVIRLANVSHSLCHGLGCEGGKTLPGIGERGD